MLFVLNNFHFPKVELDKDGNVVLLKLGDFGLACEVTEPLLSVCGTPTYVAPEILMETGYGVKVCIRFFYFFVTTLKVEWKRII